MWWRGRWAWGKAWWFWIVTWAIAAWLHKKLLWGRWWWWTTRKTFRGTRTSIKMKCRGKWRSRLCCSIANNWRRRGRNVWGATFHWMITETVIFQYVRNWRKNWYFCCLKGRRIGKPLERTSVLIINIDILEMFLLSGEIFIAFSKQSGVSPSFWIL